MLLALFVAISANMALGFAWFSPHVFGETFVRYTFPGKSMRDIQERPLAIPLALLGHVAVVNGVSFFVSFLQPGSLLGVLQIILWLSVIHVGLQVPHVVYSQTPTPLFLINLGFDILGCAMATVIYYYLG